MELAFNYETNACGILHYISIQYLFKSLETFKFFVKNLVVTWNGKESESNKANIFWKKKSYQLI